jgi:ubiquinone/menaquinone biosynthesis C-methylase UbiE
MCCRCTSTLFERAIAPRFVHMACQVKAFSEMRRRIVPEARGIVVEVGFGSGHNLPHYDPAKVARLIGIDPDRTMLGLAGWHRHDFARPLERVEASAEDMPLAAASADTVVVTYALCTIPNVDRALAEIRRVLRPGGRLLFAEHARADTPFRQRCQESLNGIWGRLAGGCHLDRDPQRSLEDAGFATRDAVRMRFTGMLWLLGDHVAGVAEPVN